jgi:arsenate reductase-like glutaredoxin family protein
MIKPKTSQDLFNKIRSKFSNIQLGDSAGNVTADPKSAVFFDFEFSENSDNFGRVSISIADGESMKVFYNQGLVEKIDDTARADWYNFLKELKDFAVEHQISFDVRDITKSSLTQQDFKNLADVNQTVNTDDNMSEELNRITKLAGIPVAESLKGTRKSSYENLDKTRLIIRHAKAVDESVPGARSRQINSLYIENAQGERFKYPMKHLAGARAMARHVANGGVPHDDFGKHIISMSEQIAQLNSFARYAANKDQLNNSVGDIIEKSRLKLENMRNYVKNLSKQAHYMKTKESFQPTTIAELDDATRNSLREKFTLKHLDDKVESALPLIHSLMQEYDDRDGEIPAPVNQSAMVQSFLANPEKKLVLRADPAADKMLSVTKFSNKNTMLSSILSDIASRMLTRNDEEDRIANFASQVADDMGNEGAPFFKPDENYTRNKKIAIQLAKRYIDDYKKMQQDPAYADEVRQDPSKFAPKKDRQGRAKGESEEFEKWANRTESKVNEGIHSLPDEDHAGENFSKLKDVMSKHFPVGTEAVNAVSTLQGLGFGDDDLFDQLGELADREGPDACACETVKNYIMNTLLKSPNIQNYYTPEQITALQDAASASDNRQGKEANKSDDHFDTAMTQTAMDSVQEASDRPIMIDGKEVDLNTVEYEMQDVGDNIFDLQDARFKDGTELSDEQMEKLMVDMDFNEWVQQDHIERRMESVAVKEKDEPADVGLSPQARDYGMGNVEKEEVQKILDQNAESWQEVLAGENLITFGKLYRELLSYYMSNGEMPYEVAKAREGDPEEWIMDRLGELGLMESIKEANVNINDEYRFRDWLKKTHNKDVHQLTPQEYIVVSKQYRDEQGTKTEGNEFAQAVQKAKAAGIKPGDKFKVGDKEYTLKDAIELAGMQLEDFDFAAESVGGGPTIRQMTDLELANFLHTSVAEVKKDREAAEEAAMEINQKYDSDNESVKEDELSIIKRLSGI